MILQVVWFRKISLFLGATTEAASVTLAVFMLGLAFGSFLAKPLLKLSRKPLFVLVIIELGIAAYGVLSLHALDAAGAVYGRWFGGQLIV